MTVNWRKPEGAFLIPIQKFFFEQGASADLVVLQEREHADPAVSFVYAPEVEVAKRIGINPNVRDHEGVGSSPLSHLSELDFDEQAEAFDSIIPPSVRYEFFIATVEGESFVFCHDAVLDYEP